MRTRKWREFHSRQVKNLSLWGPLTNIRTLQWNNKKKLVRDEHFKKTLYFLVLLLRTIVHKISNSLWNDVCDIDFTKSHFFFCSKAIAFSLLVSDGKTYDAYILCPKTPGEGSTCNSDIFVFKVMPEVLEKQCGYKLFICGRDDYVGESMYAVERSDVLYN